MYAMFCDSKLYEKPLFPIESIFGGTENTIFACLRWNISTNSGLKCLKTCRDELYVFIIIIYELVRHKNILVHNINGHFGHLFKVYTTDGL